MGLNVLNAFDCVFFGWGGGRGFLLGFDSIWEEL